MADLTPVHSEVSRRQVLLKILSGAVVGVAVEAGRGPDKLAHCANTFSQEWHNLAATLMRESKPMHGFRLSC